jgi:hypothetical protein
MNEFPKNISPWRLILLVGDENVKERQVNQPQGKTRPGFGDLIQKT